MYHSQPQSPTNSYSPPQSWSFGSTTRSVPGLARALPGLSLSSKSCIGNTSPPLSPPESGLSWLSFKGDANRLTPPPASGSIKAPGPQWVPSTPTPVKAPAARPAKQPAKSNYALWVGNLPPKATLEELCVLFGSMDLMSIYLIHRTGCAFVNYKNAAALDEATKLFETRGGKIRDHRLVIKAQKMSEKTTQSHPVQPAGFSPDRFFICKSLTVHDLKSAKTTGQWATQVHNRDKFNEAFKTSENVYFVFSANRASSFYGFARMTSPIPDEVQPVAPSEPSEDNTVVEHVNAYNKDGVTYPEGRIVKDTVRGCIYWESMDQDFEQVEADIDENCWTAPCSIEWLSGDSQVLFSRARQLRNPLNANKPVKIARDGTEIAPSVGRQLCELFDES